MSFLLELPPELLIPILIEAAKADGESDASHPQTLNSFTRQAGTEHALQLAVPTRALGRLARLSTVCRYLYSFIHDSHNDSALWKPWVQGLTEHDAVPGSKDSGLTWRNLAIWIVGWDGRDRGRTNFSPAYSRPLVLRDRLEVNIPMPEVKKPVRMILGNAVGSVTRVLGAGRFLLQDQLFGLRVFEAGRPPVVLRHHQETMACKHLSEGFSCQPELVVDSHEADDGAVVVTLMVMQNKPRGWEMRRRWHVCVGNKATIYRIVSNNEASLLVQLDRSRGSEEDIASRIACFVEDKREPLWELSLADFNDLGDNFVSGNPAWWIESFQVTSRYLICLVRNRCFFDARKGLFRVLDLETGVALHTVRIGMTRWDATPFHNEQIRDFIVTPRHIIYAKRTLMIIVDWITANGSFYILPTPFQNEAKLRNTGKTLFYYISMCVDEQGRMLYAVTSTGWLVVWDIWKMQIEGAYRGETKKPGPQALWLVDEQNVHIWEQKRKASRWMKQIRG